jgi:small-conductance mechanosensitive channel
MSDLWQQLSDAFRGLFESIVAWTPRVVVGIVLVLLALLVAKLIERLFRALLVRVKFDSALGKVGVDSALQRIGVRQQMTVLLPRIVYWLLLILFAKTAADSLGLLAVSGAIGAFVAYLPNVIAAVLILMLGSAAAQFAGRAVAEAAESSGIDFASSLGGVVSAVLLFVIGIMAIAQLKIDTDIVRLITTGLLAGMALAFGLSFGLGSRDVTRNIIAGFYARKTFLIGEEMEVAGERGTLTSITPTQTILERDGQRIAVANSVFLEQVVKQ